MQRSRPRPFSNPDSVWLGRGQEPRDDVSAHHPRSHLLGGLLLHPVATQLMGAQHRPELILGTIAIILANHWHIKVIPV